MRYGNNDVMKGSGEEERRRRNHDVKNLEVDRPMKRCLNKKSM